jgi:hypothetical protein
LCVARAIRTAAFLIICNRVSHDEPEKGDPSVVMKVLKQTVARRLLAEASDHFWQKRFCDFNVFSYASQPGEVGIGRRSRGLALEQLSHVRG